MATLSDSSVPAPEMNAADPSASLVSSTSVEVHSAAAAAAVPAPDQSATADKPAPPIRHFCKRCGLYSITRDPAKRCNREKRTKEQGLPTTHSHFTADGELPPVATLRKLLRFRLKQDAAGIPLAPNKNRWIDMSGSGKRPYCFFCLGGTCTDGRDTSVIHLKNGVMPPDADCLAAFINAMTDESSVDAFLASKRTPARQARPPRHAHHHPTQQAGAGSDD
ncbi:hypothetical protein QKU48_gp0138 [Fadolivirus algeromassiliense]|jgi:hypothetical protein|uniref:Uncharacterized protein n=1 Tax=Fadolivirus FV1/VV64 TaxID=3070911 RepID=A0A7D3V7A5_9VIRU|nr:hypothetical protein QKU48_gp0138 [Fadolivirus algeromassiliense]QKF93596.1 hypothetical protein Fadolivirus_1_138 [Fadolivirus FV1/VV64]